MEKTTFHSHTTPLEVLRIPVGLAACVLDGLLQLPSEALSEDIRLPPRVLAPALLGHWRRLVAHSARHETATLHSGKLLLVRFAFGANIRGSAGRYLGLGDVAANNFATEELLNLLVYYPNVNNYSVNIYVLKRTVGAMVERQAERQKRDQV